MTRKEAEFWRSVIRIIAAVCALFGLVLMANEILENVISCQIGNCQSIHLVPMVWGVGLVIGGSLILQKGDVSLSVDELLDAGERVRNMWGRRAYDKAPATKVEEKIEHTIEVKEDGSTRD